MSDAKPFVQAETSDARTSPAAAPRAKPDMTAPRLVLKQGATMVMVNPAGLMPAEPDQALGMIVDDTRGLKVFDLRVNGCTPVLVRGTAEASYAGHFEYRAPAQSASRLLHAGTISITSDMVVNNDFFAKLQFHNDSNEEALVSVQLLFGTGFEDMFEVRGSDRKQHGVHRAPEIVGDTVVKLFYDGLDNVPRLVDVQFAELTPDVLTGDSATFNFKIAPRSSKSISNRFSFRRGAAAMQEAITRNWSFAEVMADSVVAFRNWLTSNARIKTANQDLNRVLERAVEDINMLRLGQGGIAAGLPQFAVPFGRDSAIAGLQTCWLMPDLSRRIILALASHQGTKFSAQTAEEPGKIMHELRTGEMVNCGEAPFGPYYGTVDATQLWLMLVVEYTKWSGDLNFVKEIWPNVEAAVQFLRRRSRGGYITYGGHPGEALSNQCWKDSYNSIMYSDGELAVAPIAVCEAQGYMYAAFIGIATLAMRLDKRFYATGLFARANKLKRNFQKDFWVKRLNFVALALDKNGRQCDVISSNPGHLLGLGILNRQQEKSVANRLMQPDMFNGWFIRTLASSEKAYNPDDYQVGSGWPHDNGMACAGMRSVGHDADAVKVFAAHVDIACAAPDLRLHELYCGQDRTPKSTHPKNYKVACVPQAWAAGSILHMLRACVNPQPGASTLRISKPLLPSWLPSVTIEGLRVGHKSFDLIIYCTAAGGTKHRIVQRKASQVASMAA
jgi:glycogen debranching enzyme